MCLAVKELAVQSGGHIHKQLHCQADCGQCVTGLECF